jgi:hypothetical protein
MLSGRALLNNRLSVMHEHFHRILKYLQCHALHAHSVFAAKLHGTAANARVTAGRFIAQHFLALFMANLFISLALYVKVIQSISRTRDLIAHGMV